MNSFVTAFTAVIAASAFAPAYADAIEGKRGPGEIIAAAEADDWRIVDPQQLMVLELGSGQVVIELSAHFAQGHVAQMKSLVKGGFYDGLSFYRVIDGFVAQGGDPFEKRALPDGATKALPAEFESRIAVMPEAFHVVSSGGVIDGYAGVTGVIDGFPVGVEQSEEPAAAWLLHCTGAVAMARDVPRDTGGTEIYITLQPQRYLDRNLSVFGRVLDGMEHVQALTRQPPPTEESDPIGDKIARAWMGDQPPVGETAPQYRVLKTGTPLFAEYLESRRNRPEAFFYHRSDYVDICQLPVPAERISERSPDAGENE